MKGLRFPVGCDAAEVAESPAPLRVRLDRCGFSVVSGLKKKSLVAAGALLATHPALDRGDLFASVSGEITEITDDDIVIAAVPSPAEGAVEPPADVPVIEASLAGDGLAAVLKKLGVDTAAFTAACETLIVNGLDPDPGISWAVPLLKSQHACLAAGFGLLGRLSQAQKVVLAVPQGTAASLASFDGVETREVPGEYPAGLDPLVIHAVTGKEAPDNVHAVSLHDLWGLGRVGLTGRPLTETVLTVSDGEYPAHLIVPEGFVAADLLELAKIPLEQGDMLLHDGTMRGAALSSAEWGVRKTTTGLFVLPAGSVAPLDGASACINCGTCVSVCPARLSPGRLSSYAEFGMYDKCRDEGLLACMDCGLCTYVCMARRPVSQYLRMARSVSA